MRCWQRPEWAEYFECFRVLMGTPLQLTLPGWAWWLISFVIGAVLPVLSFSVTDMIFGKYASLRPFEWVGEQAGERSQARAGMVPARVAPVPAGS